MIQPKMDSNGTKKSSETLNFVGIWTLYAEGPWVPDGQGMLWLFHFWSKRAFIKNYILYLFVFVKQNKQNSVSYGKLAVFKQEQLAPPLVLGQLS